MCHNYVKNRTVCSNCGHQGLEPKIRKKSVPLDQKRLDEVLGI